MSAVYDVVARQKEAKLCVLQLDTRCVRVEKCKTANCHVVDVGSGSRITVRPLLRFASFPFRIAVRRRATDRPRPDCLPDSVRRRGRKEEDGREREGRERGREVGRQIWGTLLPVRMWRRRLLLPTTTVEERGFYEQVAIVDKFALYAEERLKLGRLS